MRQVMVTSEVAAVGVAEGFLSSNLTMEVAVEVRAHTMVSTCNGIPSNLVNSPHLILLNPCLIRAMVNCCRQCNNSKTLKVSKVLVNMLTSRLSNASSLIRVSLSNTTN